MSGSQKRIIITAMAIVIAALLSLLYYYVAPAVPWLMPKCMFHEFTGYRCPGCGLQRALIAALQGDFAAAIRYNYSLLITIPVLALYLMAWVLRERLPRLYRFLGSLTTFCILLVLMLAWWIGRNIAGV